MDFLECAELRALVARVEVAVIAVHSLTSVMNAVEVVTRKASVFKVVSHVASPSVGGLYLLQDTRVLLDLASVSELDIIGKLGKVPLLRGFLYLQRSPLLVESHLNLVCEAENLIESLLNFVLIFVVESLIAIYYFVEVAFICVVVFDLRLRNQENVLADQRSSFLVSSLHSILVYLCEGFRNNCDK